MKDGQADAFVAAWIEFAEWTAANVPGAGRGTLLRDLDDPTRFVSVGPWESLEAIAEWRKLPGWTERVEKIGPMLVGFEPATLELVAEHG